MSHAALMDQVYRHQRYLYDFTRKYYLLGRDELIQNLRLRGDDRVVEVGCGTARNLIKIARLHPGVRLFGIDASQEMLLTARKAIRRAGLEDRIILAQGLAEELSPRLFGEEAFDAVLFSYSLSMIADWDSALTAAGAALSSRGAIHIVDFGDLKGLPPAGERLLRRWLGLFHVEPRGELLAGLESWTGQSGGTSLHIFAGRYAFMLSCPGQESLPASSAVAV
ncbi:MAG TPA: class I SAM-dependent methyltransferase [Rhizomicrobium sp.]